MRGAPIHALRHLITPVEAAFARSRPGAATVDLPDGSPFAGLARGGRLTPAMVGRCLAPARHAAGAELRRRPA